MTDQQPFQMSTVELIHELNEFSFRQVRVLVELAGRVGIAQFAGVLEAIDALNHEVDIGGGYREVDQ